MAQQAQGWNQEKSLKESQHLPHKAIHKTFEIQKPAPCTMLRGSATMYGSVTYFALPNDRKVQSYNSETKKWSDLPECPRVQFTLAVVNDLVTTVGGKKDGKHTNTLLSLKEESGNLMWVKHFPPMLAERKYPAVVCSENVLVVAGGLGRNKTTLDTVEVMNTDTLQWSKAGSLTQPLSDASATVCGDRVYLVGGKNQDGYYTNVVLTCSLSALLQSQTMKAAKTKRLGKKITLSWHLIADLSVTCSTCVTVNGQLLAVGGCESDGSDSNNIYSYNTETNSWNVISQMSTARSQCLVTVLPDNKLMVVGGMIEDYNTDKVEIITLQGGVTNTNTYTNEVEIITLRKENQAKGNGLQVL